MLEKKGTCPNCGYEKKHCMCGRKKNTSGDYQLYQNYNDLRGISDYATTSRIQSASAEERKFMEELSPVDGEELYTYIKRTDIAENALIKYSVQHHLFGTKSTWQCHTGSRYCFICSSAQLLNVQRALWNSVVSLSPEMGRYRIHLSDDTPPSISLSLP